MSVVPERGVEQVVDDVLDMLPKPGPLRAEPGCSGGALPAGEGRGSAARSGSPEGRRQDQEPAAARPACGGRGRYSLLVLNSQRRLASSIGWKPSTLSA